MCRPRQCSSATNWWKFPSVTFSVSSKDSRGFCSGKEVLIPQTPQPQPLRACTPPTATEPAPPPRGMARRGEVRQARCRWSARPADLRGRKMGHSFSLQALQLGVDVGQSSLGQSQPLREGRREEDPVVQAPSPLQSGDTGLGPLEPTSSPRTPKSCPQPPPPPPSSLARIPNLLKGVGDGLVAEEIIVQDV